MKKIIIIVCIFFSVALGQKSELKNVKVLNFHDISCWVCHRGNKHPDHPPNKNK